MNEQPCLPLRGGPMLKVKPQPTVTEAAIERSQHARSDAWKQDVLAVVAKVARGQQYLSVDDIWEVAGTALMGTNPHTLGPVMRMAVRDGLIKPTAEYRESTRVEHHRRPLRVWESLVVQR